MKVDSRDLKWGVIVGALGCVFGLVIAANEGLGLHIVLLTCLYVVTCVLVRSYKFDRRNLHTLFSITILIHVGLVLVVHYSQFYPFGGARDDLFYHRVAVLIAERFKEGNFSLAGISMPHWYPVFLGSLYTITLPEILIGKATVIWLAGISAILIYLIVREIGGSKKWAFLIAFCGSNAYPSYLFYGSLLRKDTLVIPLALLGVLLIIKLIISFRWKIFFLFIITSGLLTTLRIYAGFALSLAFFLSWFLTFRKRRLGNTIACVIITVPIWGYMAQVLDYGFLGIRTTRKLLDPEFIVHFRRTQYSIGGSSAGIKADFSSPKAFIKYYFPSFINVLLGPLPWQIKETRHLYSLIEVIPWYLFLFFIVRGARNLFTLKTSMPPLIYGIGLIGAIALFSDNLGANSGLRMSGFLALFCLIPFGFRKFNYGKSQQKA